MNTNEVPAEVAKFAPPQERMNAAQIQAVREAAKQFGESIALKQWCVQRAIETIGGKDVDPVVIAQRIHRFVIGQDNL